MVRYMIKHLRSGLYLSKSNGQWVLSDECSKYYKNDMTEKLKKTVFSVKSSSVSSEYNYTSSQTNSDEVIIPGTEFYIEKMLLFEFDPNALINTDYEMAEKLAKTYLELPGTNDDPERLKNLALEMAAYKTLESAKNIALINLIENAGADIHGKLDEVKYEADPFYVRATYKNYTGLCKYNIM